MPQANDNTPNQQRMAMLRNVRIVQRSGVANQWNLIVMLTQVHQRGNYSNE